MCHGIDVTQLTAVEQPYRPAETERDPIPGEGHQPMAPDEADQTPHDRNGDHKCADEPNGDQIDAAHGQGSPAFPKIEHRRPEHGRDCEIERELGRSDAGRRVAWRPEWWRPRATHRGSAPRSDRSRCRVQSLSARLRSRHIEASVPAVRSPRWRSHPGPASSPPPPAMVSRFTVTVKP
jgi:hypothetical protein